MSDQVEQGEAPRIRVGPADGAGGLAEALRKLRHQPGGVGRRRGSEQRSEGLVVQALRQRPDDLDPYPVRSRAAALPGSAPQHPDPLLGRMTRQVLGERGLADPRLPRNEEQGPATTDRILEASQQLGQFPTPADKGRPRRLRPPMRDRSGTDEWILRLRAGAGIVGSLLIHGCPQRHSHHRVLACPCSIHPPGGSRSCPAMRPEGNDSLPA